jgi:hypothetical protein
MAQRLELGFDGGAVLRLTVEESAATDLLGSLSGDSDWRSIEAEEGTHWLNMEEILYIRVVPREPGRVGFGGD